MPRFNARLGIVHVVCHAKNSAWVPFTRTEWISIGLARPVSVMVAFVVRGKALTMGRFVVMPSGGRIWERM